MRYAQYGARMSEEIPAVEPAPSPRPRRRLIALVAVAVLLAGGAAYALWPSGERFSTARELADRLAAAGLPCARFDQLPDRKVGKCYMPDESYFGLSTDEELTGAQRDELASRAGKDGGDYAIIFGSNWAAAGYGNRERLRKIADLLGAEYRTS